MKNNKGFTLMELLVAVFISSMVTIALVTIWKASSMQTSQGQRQSIIRNNLSILMRAIHRDITEADLLLAPSGLAGQEGNIIVLARNAYLSKEGGANYYAIPNLMSYTKDPMGVEIESEAVYFAYCLQGTKIKRSSDKPFTTKQTVSDLISDIEEDCENGKTYMDYVTGFNVETDDDINYSVDIIVHKNFENSDTPPIHLEMSKIFTKAGGA